MLPAMRLAIKIVLVLILLGGAYYGYTAYSAAAKKQATQGGAKIVPIEAAKVRIGERIASYNTVGTLKANESLILRPEVAGRIEAIHFTEGSTVKKGDLLISIDDRIYAAELKQAQAALTLAQATYKRAKLLKEKGVGTVSNYDMSAAALNASQAQVDLARARLDKTKIAAPFDGAVGLRMVSPGDYVNVAQDIVSFQSITPMKADFTLPESATRAVAVDQTIEMTVDAYPDKIFNGTVYAIEPQIDIANRNLTLRASVPNEGGELKAGSFAKISLITGRDEAAMFVPESAIMPRGNDNFVYVVGEGNKIATQKVETGERKGGEVAILSGLTKESIVVTAGHLKIRDGAEVTYKLAGDAK